MFPEGTPRDGTSPVRPALESEGNARARPYAGVARRRGDPKAARDPRARNAEALHSLPTYTCIQNRGIDVQRLVGDQLIRGNGKLY